MKKVSSKVEMLYKANPTLVNSDKKLLLAFWATEGLALSYEQERKFMDVTTAESITRSARNLRSTGDYDIDDKVIKGRTTLFRRYWGGEYQ